MSKVVINRIKYSLSYTDRFRLVATFHGRTLDFLIYDRVNHKRSRNRFLKSDYPDIDSIKDLVKSIIVNYQNFCDYDSVD